MADVHYDPKAKEADFRALLQKAAVGVSLFLASFVVVTVLPVFPVPVSLALAVAISVVGYKIPLLGEMLMLYLVILSLTYQLGLPLVLLIAIWIFFSIISLQALQPGGIFAVACCVIGAMLMTTRLYFVSVPLMLAAPLIRGRGRNVGSTGAILVFLALLLLLLVQNAPGVVPPQQTQPPVSLFARTTVRLEPRINYVDIDLVYSRLKEATLRTPEAVDRYLDKLSIYWPTFRTGSRNGILIIMLGLFLGVAVAVAFGILAAMKWVANRGVGAIIVPWVTPTAAILGGAAVFLVLFFSMASSFSYQTGPMTVLTGGFLVSGLALGGVASLVEYWLRRRDQFVEYQEEYLSLRTEMSARVAAATAGAEKAAATCHGLDIGPEEFAIRKAKQDFSLSTEEPDQMSMEVVKEKIGLFKEEAKWLELASKEVTDKVRRYYDDSRHKYLQYVAEFAEYGYTIAEPESDLETVPLGSLQNDRLLEAQAKLNVLYRAASEKALGYLETVGELIKSELDADLESIGLKIGRSYFEQGSYADALETLSVELRTFDRLVSQHAALLLSRTADVRFELSRAMRDSLPKIMDGLADPPGAARYSSLVSAIEKSSYPASLKVRLNELSERIEHTVQLAAIALAAVSQLAQSISTLEQAIEARSPSQYNWGKDSVVRKEAEDILQASPAGWAPLARRLARIESSAAAIEKAAAIVARYGRVLEFFINYANIEYLILEKFNQTGRVSAVELPVRESYAQEYLTLFSEQSGQGIVLQDGSGQLIRREGD